VRIGRGALRRPGGSGFMLVRGGGGTEDVETNHDCTWREVEAGLLVGIMREARGWGRFSRCQLIRHKDAGGPKTWRLARDHMYSCFTVPFRTILVYILLFSGVNCVIAVQLPGPYHSSPSSLQNLMTAQAWKDQPKGNPRNPTLQLWGLPAT